MTADREAIFHITSWAQWNAARASGAYRGSTRGKSLDAVGFIHCSYARQVVGVANANYRGERDLVLLVIDRGRLSAQVRDENLDGGAERFPHIYGPLNIDAVVEELAFEPGVDGTFDLPEAVR